MSDVLDAVPCGVTGVSSSAAVTPNSDAPPFHGLTGGVYKVKGDPCGSVADLRLPAIPASRRRVAALTLQSNLAEGKDGASAVPLRGRSLLAPGVCTLRRLERVLLNSYSENITTTLTPAIFAIQYHYDPTFTGI